MLRENVGLKFWTFFLSFFIFGSQAPFHWMLPMNVTHLISYIALNIYCTSCCLFSGLLWWYALKFMQPKRKKSGVGWPRRFVPHHKASLYISNLITMSQWPTVYRTVFEPNDFKNMLMYYGLLAPKHTVYKRNIKLIYRTW
jgi:hypothetical protein